ncbi:DUF1801 domain-containing protein [Sulfitobacter sp. M57]|uniref:DUF1801 domain-containing protein n=1 Tax=unclassified Sulfitobacter TaxID=196795 RepID=UPI0023E2C55A|nr:MULTISPECIES: DUF1801 domain-containing protein [unclassified Sulfitobacter]MDF3414525.1 DUF1801 domain-containing protein [Sulfitobacter sp. KE5]MDF3422006.1 DUF1801 domain-containing protein [Sulfitobacter sp. KE43]MDF3433071.1 DUF1801 domain-containing protein [Sulfitobacter sp. KE42]MDF3458711.1 DUF1801 domain-containing protein [Sulfitobacter sp. S74]MDF3462611.1 DUF1801 domain-containing protein [Sulfitobacter sp. Ks18]
MPQVERFLSDVAPARRHMEAARLDAFFRTVTGWQPVLWSGTMLGYGSYDYTYASGRRGRYFATGFAPRKAKLSIYIMPGYTDFSEILGRLGKHSIGKSCLYLNKLEDADMEVLAELVRAGLRNLTGIWPVNPS